MDESRQSAAGSGVSGPPRPLLVRRIRESDLERTAVQWGTVAGNAVAVYRGVRRILKERQKEQKQENGGLGAWVRERVEEGRRAAVERIREWRRADRADKDKTGELRGRGQNGTREHQYPLHIVLTAGAVGLLFGAILGVLKARAR